MHASDPSGRNLLGRKTPRRPGALQGCPRPARRCRSACASGPRPPETCAGCAARATCAEARTRRARAERAARGGATHMPHAEPPDMHTHHTRRPRAPYTDEEQPSAAAPDAHELATHALASCATATRPGTTAATGRSRQRCCTTALTVTAETLAAATAARRLWRAAARRGASRPPSRWPPAPRRRYRHCCCLLLRAPPPRSLLTPLQATVDASALRPQAPEARTEESGSERSGRFKACSRRAHLGPGFQRVALRSTPAGVGRGVPKRPPHAALGVVRMAYTSRERAAGRHGRQGRAPSNTRARRCCAALCCGSLQRAEGEKMHLE